MLKRALEHNARFVKENGYLPYVTTKYPDRKVAIITCMDTRLVELLPAAMGYKNGEVMVIKNAGGIISHPFGSVPRSLVIAIYELGIEEIWVIGHTDCGVQHLDFNSVIEKMHRRGISPETTELIGRCGIDYKKWLEGFSSADGAVLKTMEQIDTHPLIPNDITIHGMVIDSQTGELKLIHSIEKY